VQPLAEHARRDDAVIRRLPSIVPLAPPVLFEAGLNAGVHSLHSLVQI